MRLKFVNSQGHTVFEQLDDGSLIIHEEAYGDLALEEATVVPYASGPVMNSDTWDGEEAKRRIAKWASSDGSGDKDKIDWNKYRKAFLIVDGDPKNFGSYKYPHHWPGDDGKLYVHKKGVQTAMAYLMKYEPRNKAAYNHLAKHYKELGLEPPKREES